MRPPPPSCEGSCQVEVCGTSGLVQAPVRCLCEPGQAALGLRAERCGRVELAQHPHHAERDPVDEQVRRGQVELHSRGRLAQIGQAHRLGPYPGPLEVELLVSQRFEEWHEVPQQLVGVDGHRRLHEPLASKPRQDSGSVPVEGPAGQQTDGPRESSREPVDRTEVQDRQAPVVHQPEVAGVRVGVQQVGASGPAEEQLPQQQARPVALLGCSGLDQGAQRCAVDPFADEHLIRGEHDIRHQEVRPLGERLAKGSLGPGLAPVVELLVHPALELVDQRRHVEPRVERADHPHHAADLRQV